LLFSFNRRSWQCAGGLFEKYQKKLWLSASFFNFKSPFYPSEKKPNPVPNYQIRNAQSRYQKQGESFKHIADLVGHKHIATTFIYTKIDFNALAQVALELPEVEYETC
jgi:hypothetical protein